MATITEKLRLWFIGCPLFVATSPFLVDNMGANPTEYGIFTVPSDLAYTQYFSGKTLNPIQTLNFVLASTDYFGLDVIQNLENIGFFDGIQSWVIAHNTAGALPTISEGTVQNITVNNTVYLMSATEDTAKYQIQCSITYRI